MTTVDAGQPSRSRIVRVLWAARRMPLRAAVRVARRIPGPVRPVIGSALVGLGVLLGGRRSTRVGAPLLVYGRWLRGDEEGAARQAAELGAGAGPVGAARLIQFLVAIDRPSSAETLSDRLTGTGIEIAVARWELARALGRLDAAEAALLEESALHPADRGLATLLDRARGERRIVDPAWRPAIVRASRAGNAVPGRILHVQTNSLPHRQTGYTYRSLEVGRSQRAVGLDPVLATRAGFPGPGVRAADRDSVDGLIYHRIEPRLDGLTRPDVIIERTAAGLSRLVDELHPALLHPASNHPNAQAALAVGRAVGIPVVYEVRGFLEETWASRVGAGHAASERYVGSRDVETACMVDADAVVTLSETMRAEIIERGVGADRVHVVPNAVDVDVFEPRPVDAGFRAGLGIGSDEVVLGYITSLVGYEGIRYLIEATRILRDRGRAVRTLIVGDGAVRPELEALSEELGLGSSVLFTGRVPRTAVLDYYAAIDVFVVPRTNDRVCHLVTPLKPYEAMAMERAMIVSNVGALREIVVPGETGAVFRAEDAVDLADVAEPLLSDPALRARLGRQARIWVTENRTWQMNGRRYRDLFERLGALG